MPDLRPDPGAPFTGLLAHLIQLLRQTPGEEYAIRETVGLLVSRVATRGAGIEAGIENSWALDGDPLKERLQARQVDDIQVAAGASGEELLNLARALADDTAPIPSGSKVRVKLLPDPLPIQFSGPRDSMPDLVASPVPRARTGDQLAQMVEGILKELEKAIKREQWLAALHDAQAAQRLLPGVQEDFRRTFALALRRLITRPVIQALIEQAYRIPEEQPRTAEVIRAGGIDAAELMVDLLKGVDTVGPRSFLVDAIAGMPEALPLLTPLLRSPRPSDVRLGAELLGRIGLPEAIPALVAQAQHPDDRVRHAVIDALGQFKGVAVVEPLRQALSHASPATRSHAGRALAQRGSGAIAMPLLAALEQEKDPGAWEHLLGALAGINAPEAASALVRMATEPRKLLDLGGAQQRRQLAVVRALAASGTAAARQALERVAAEGRGDVKVLAAELLAGSSG